MWILTLDIHDVKLSLWRRTEMALLLLVLRYLVLPWQTSSKEESYKLYQLRGSACIRTRVTEFTMRPPRGASAFPARPFTLARGRESHGSRCVRRIVLYPAVSRSQLTRYNRGLRSKLRCFRCCYRKESTLRR